MRHLEVGKDLFVERVIAIQKRLHFAEEHARLSTLNDAVIIGASQGHDLA